MSAWTEFLVALLAYGGVLLASVLVLGAITLVRRPTPFPWLPMRRLRKGRWSGREVFFVFFLLLMIPDPVSQLLNEIGFFQTIFARPPSPLRHELWSRPLSYLIIIACVLGFLHLSSQTRPPHVGLSWAQGLANLWRGWAVFAVWTPVVLGIYMMAVFVLGGASEHPFQKLVKEGLMPVEWALLIASGVVIGPVLEELLFRGVLLGWLRRASLVGHGVVAVMILFVGLAFGLKKENEVWVIMPGVLLFGFLLALLYALAVMWVWRPVLQAGNRYFYSRPPLQGEDIEPAAAIRLQRDDVRWRTWLHANAWLGILGSASLFALLHGNVWPSPIPLLLLGIGLGWLAYRTQSLIGCIVCHGLFNAVAVVGLILTPQFEEAAPEPPPPNGKEASKAWRPPPGSRVSTVPGS